MPDGGRLLVYQPRPSAARCLVRTVERLVAASRPDKRREARLTTCALYPHRFHLACAICRAVAYLQTYAPLANVGYRAIQRLKTKESSYDTFDERA
jgi:hypothetical protein